MKLKCTIKGCSKDRYIGFIHYLTHQKWNICQKHYYEWINSRMELNLYVRMQSTINDKSQTRLERIKAIEEKYS